MRVDPKKIEIDEWTFNKNYAHNPGFNNVHENVKLTDFIYLNPDPDIFKLVLHWDASIKNKKGGQTIASIIAEHEFIMRLDGNEDKETLKNMISSSHLHLQDEFTERVKETWLSSYRFLWFDCDQFAEQIIAKVKSGNKQS
jgi:hypothetical protein